MARRFRLDSPPYVAYPVPTGITFTFGGLMAEAVFGRRAGATPARAAADVA